MSEKDFKGAFMLIDALCEAYDNLKWKPHNGTTFCNLAVQWIMEKIGYAGFKNMVANQMVEKMREGKKWKPVKMESAQFFANQGNVIALGIRDSPHGHIAIVRPGVQVYSNKWKTYCPKLMNIGIQNSISKGANWVFTKQPEVFIYLG